MVTSSPVYVVRRQLLTCAEDAAGAQSLEPRAKSAVLSRLVETVKGLWHNVHGLLQQRNTRHALDPCAKSELLILVAEAATAVASWDIANDACRTYFRSEQSRKDNFACRALLAKAQIEGAKSHGLTGAYLTQQARHAASYATEALRLAKAAGSRYDFCARNACVILWSILFPILVPGRIKYARDALIAGCDALDGDSLCLYARATAAACDDAGDSLEAIKYLRYAIDSASNKHEAMMQASSLVRFGGQALNFAESIAPTQPRRAADLHALRRLRSTPGDVLDRIRAIAEPTDDIDVIADAGRLCARIDSEAAKTFAKTCLARTLNAKHVTAVTRVKIDFLRCWLISIELDGDDCIPEWAATSPGLDGLSTQFSEGRIRCYGPKATSKQLRVARLSRRIEALKVLERALMASARLCEPELTQEGCALVWNIGLALTQPHVRKHIHRAFRVAAQLLEELKSPLVEVRARLHMELAHCELAADFVSKARNQLAAISRIDYGNVDAAEAERDIDRDADLHELTAESPPHHAAALDVEKRYALRPLDRYADPLNRRLELRASGADPETAEDKATLVLDHALEVPSAQLQWKMLAQVASILIEAEADSQPLANTSELAMAALNGDAAIASWGSALAGAACAALDISPWPMPTMGAQLGRLEQGVRLWTSLIELAWRLHRNAARPLVQAGAGIVLRCGWPEATHAELCASQVICQYALAETYMDELYLTAEKALKEARWHATSEDNQEAHRTKTLLSDETLRREAIALALAKPPSEWIDMGIDCAVAYAQRSSEPGVSANAQQASDFVVPEGPQQLTALKRLSAATCAAGIERARRLANAKLVRNGCVLLWNHHSHICRGDKKYALCIPELVSVFDRALEAAVETNVRDEWLCAGLSQLIAGIHASRGDQGRAIEVCATAALQYGVTRPLAVKGVVEMHAKLTLGDKPLARSEKGKQASEESSLFRAMRLLEKMRLAANGSEIEVLVRDATEAIELENRHEHKSAKERSDLARELLSSGNAASDVDVARAFMLPRRREADAERLELRMELWARVCTASLRSSKGSPWTAYCATKCLEELGDNRQPHSPYDEDGCYECAEQHLTTSLRRPGASDDYDATDISMLQFEGDVPLTAWRWAAVAETARARTIEESVDAASKRKEQDIVLMRAFAHYSRAMRFGVTAQQWPELTFRAGSHLWEAAAPLTQSPAARRLVKAPIKCALACLYASGEAKGWAGGGEVMELISSLLETLLDCEADDANWSRGLKIIDDAMPRLGLIANAIQREVAGQEPCVQTVDARMQKNALEHGEDRMEATKLDANGVRRSLLNRRVIFLSKLGRSQAATQLKSDGEAREVARVWATFARSSADPRQQVAAYRKVLDVTSSMFDRVEYLVEVAEWMLQRGATRREARSALCLAMDYCLEVESREDNAETIDTRSVSGFSCTGDDASQRSEWRNHLSTNSLKSGSQRCIVSHAPKLLSAEHLELLVRILSMLAQLSTNLSDRRHYVLLGHHYACVCVKRHVAAANAAIKLRLDSTTTEEKGDENTCPYIEPTSISSWCNFMIDEKFVEWTRSTPRSHRRDVFTAETWRRLPLAAHHLTYLIDALIDFGFHAHALAPLSLLQLLGMLTSSSPSNRPSPLAVLAGVRRTRLLYALGANSAAQLQFEALGKLGPSSEDAFEASDVERLFDASGETQTTTEKDWKVSQLSTRWVWVGIAAEMVGLEEVEIGEEYLSAARQHNIAFHDYDCAARSAEIAAWIAARRGALGEAKKLFRAAQSRAVHDFKAWTRLALSLARISLAVDERCEARALLEKTLEKMPCVEDFDVLLARIQVEILLARLEASKGEVDTAKKRLESVIEQLDVDRNEPPHPIELDARASFSQLIISQEGIIECAETVLRRARSLWAAAWPATIDVGGQMSLPIARRVGSLCLSLCRLRLAAARRSDQLHYDDTYGGDAAKIWLEKTAPLKVDSTKFEPLNFEKAAFHVASAAGVARITPSALPAVAAASGETAAVAAAHYGKLDSVWDDSPEAEEQIAACLNTSTPSDSVPIVSDAVDSLSVAISSGLRVGRFEEVGAAALSLAEVCGGGVKPKTTSRALLLHQSCVARRWFARFMRTTFAFDARCPHAISAHVMARCGSHYGLGVDDGGFAWRSCDDDILGREDGAACLYAPLTTTPSGLCGGLLQAAMSSSLPLAHPVECPAVQRECAKLAERSVAWSILDLGSMPTIDEMIAALPDLFIISLQLSSDALYATVLRTSSGEAAVAKYPMQPGDWSDVSKIDAATRQWRKPRQQPTLDADEISALTRRVSSFFAPVLEANANVAAALEAISVATEIATGKSKQTTGARPVVCILADIRFQRWPLEGLEQFRRLDARFSRDFSIHTLYGRLGDQIESFAYLADPHSTSEHLESLRPFTKGWTGISGREVEKNECEKMLSDCRNGAFVYYGPGRSPTRIPANLLASLDLRKSIRLALLLDRDDNAAARRYRLKADAGKKPAELALEDPLETAAAWTLAGVGAVVINQWQSTFEANRVALQRIVSGLKEKLPLVEAVHAVSLVSSDEADGHLTSASDRLNPVLFGLPTLSHK